LITIDSRDEAKLRLLILNPESVEVEASDNTREAARRIHAFFMRERGWTLQDLVRHRFRDLAALCEEGKVVLAITRGGVDWARKQDDLVLHLMLADLKTQQPRFRKRTLKRLLGANVKTVLSERKLALTEADWKYVESLALRQNTKLNHHSRGGHELASALVKLLEDAYGRER
jgi:hypothetical protein